MSTPSVQLSARTWPIRSVQVQLGSSGPISMSEPKIRVASGSQKDPVHRRAEQEPPRERPIPLTTEALAARDDSLPLLRRRVATSISRSACPAPSSAAVGGSEEQDELRRRLGFPCYAYSIRQDTAGYGRIRQDTAGYGRIRQDTAGYGRIRQDTAGYAGCGRIRQNTAGYGRYGRIRQDTAGYGRIRQSPKYPLAPQG